MKKFVISMALVGGLWVPAYAQTSPTPAAVTQASPAPAVAVANPTPVPLYTVPDPIFQPPEFLSSAILAVKGMPGIGPIAVKVFMWAGVLASILTAISLFFMTIAKTMAGVARIDALSKVAMAIQKFCNMVLPYVKYLSMFNVAPSTPATTTASTDTSGQNSSDTKASS